MLDPTFFGYLEDLTVSWCIVAAGVCRRAESVTPDCGKSRWNVNISSTHSSSWLLSFPLQRECLHTPHTFHPVCSPQPTANSGAAFLTLRFAVQVLICYDLHLVVGGVKCLELGESRARKGEVYVCLSRRRCQKSGLR